MKSVFFGGGVGIGNPIFCLFLMQNDNGGPVGNRGFQGRGNFKPNIKQIVKKKSVKKSQKTAKSEKNWKKSIFLLKMV